MRETALPPPQRDAGLAQEKTSVAAWLTIGVTFAVCFARFARLIKTGAVDVLFGDQWGFLVPLFRGEGPWSLFWQQHGPHRQGAGGALQWLIYRASGWDVRWEAWAGLAILSAGAVAALALAARIRGRLVWWDAALVLIVLSPMHWETLLLAPNLAHSVLPLCLTLLLVHAWFARSLPARIVSVGFVGALCTFTGFAFCASFAAGLVGLATLSPANAERRGAWWIPVALAGGVALFLIGYQWAPAIPGWHFPVANWWDYGTFAAYMGATLAGLREKTMPAIAVGGTLCLVMAAVCGRSLWQIWRCGATKRTVASALLTGTSLTYLAFTAVGRLPAGVEAAFMWRYTSLTMAGAVGAIIFFQPWTQISANKAWRRITVTAMCAFAVTIWINVGPDQRVATISAAKRNWVAAYLATRDLARANQISDFWVYPPMPDAPHIAEHLRWLADKKLSFLREPPTALSAKPAP